MFYIIFTTPGAQEALSKVNIDFTQPDAYSKLRSYLSVSDVIQNLQIDRQARQHPSLASVDYGSYFETSLSDPAYQHEIKSHVLPLLDSQESKNEALNYLRPVEGFENIMGEQPLYRLSVVKNVLVIGVEQGFFQTFIDKTSEKKFYRNCLELCQSTIPGVDLTQSNLFGKFVKLSISF